jgi:hypothetical protein
MYAAIMIVFDRGDGAKAVCNRIKENHYVFTFNMTKGDLREHQRRAPRLPIDS